MQIRDIEKLVDLVNESNVSEVSIRTDSGRVTIRKSSLGRVVASLPVDEMEPIDQENQFQTDADEEVEQSSQLYFISAPMVGIYRYAEPPIAAGLQVESGQVVGMIESMKLMNDIRSDRDGIVKEVYAEAGLAVEYGQPLFEVVKQNGDGSNV